MIQGLLRGGDGLRDAVDGLDFGIAPRAVPVDQNGKGQRLAAASETKHRCMADFANMRMPVVNGAAVGLELNDRCAPVTVALPLGITLERNEMRVVLRTYRARAAAVA